MNSKERVRLAFAHKEADRVPIFELTIDNPTASHVLGRPTLCGFGGQARGVMQLRALQEGWIEDYHRQRAADEIVLYGVTAQAAGRAGQPLALEALVRPERSEGVAGGQLVRFDGQRPSKVTFQL